jgi:prolyl-tRNA editing enzyme YbaK/EbsC (Cys-tRNA(Pro) deacylase)
MHELPDATKRFLAAVSGLGFTIEPRVFPDGTRTSADAARAVGCELSAIAKSLVFMAGDDAVLVLMSGDKRVDTSRLAELRGVERARRATLDEAREHTGYAAGGTPAFGLIGDPTVYADVSLQRHAEVWSAAGTPTTVYPIALKDLIEASEATWADLAE